MIGVVQVGPAPGSPGGMSAVIGELLTLDLPGVRMESVPSWSGASGRLTASIRAARTIRRAGGTAAIAHLHLSEYGSFLREGALAHLARRTGLKVVMTLHGARFPEQIQRFPGLTARVLRQADVVLCLGPQQRDLVRTVLPRADVRLVSNPVEVRAEPPSGCGGDGGPTFLFAGEVGPRKGMDLLADAWLRVHALVPSARLLVAGPLVEPWTDEDRWKPFSDAGVDYLGVLDRPRLAQVMADADVCVLPSRAEVLPMTVLEALALGRRVIVTDVGECASLAPCEGVDLLPAPCGDPDVDVAVLERALNRALRGDRTDPVAIQRWVRGFASRETVARTLSAVYHELGERSAAGGRRETVPC